MKLLMFYWKNDGCWHNVLAPNRSLVKELSKVESYNLFFRLNEYLFCNWEAFYSIDIFLNWQIISLFINPYILLFSSLLLNFVIIRTISLGICCWIQLHIKLIDCSHKSISTCLFIWQKLRLQAHLLPFYSSCFA